MATEIMENTTLDYQHELDMARAAREQDALNDFLASGYCRTHAMGIRLRIERMLEDAKELAWEANDASKCGDDDSDGLRPETLDSIVDDIESAIEGLKEAEK